MLKRDLRDRRVSRRAMKMVRPRGAGWGSLSAVCDGMEADPRAIGGLPDSSDREAYARRARPTASRPSVRVLGVTAEMDRAR